MIEDVDPDEYWTNRTAALLRQKIRDLMAIAYGKAKWDELTPEQQYEATRKLYESVEADVAEQKRAKVPR